MQTTPTSIKDWMDSMCLKLNTYKTDFIIFCSTQQLRKLDKSPLDSNGNLIPKSKVVRYLRGHLDTSLTFETHVNTKVKTGKGKLNQDQINLRLPISKSLHHTHPNVMHNTHRLCKWQMQYIWIHSQGHQQVSITSEHVCKINIKKIQILKFNRISLQLHWLPVSQRIDYKILTLSHKCIQEQASKYLQDLINIKQSRAGISDQMTQAYY